MSGQHEVLIIDGYSDEPAGLGVPPYIDVYPRYIAGAIWAVNKSTNIVYLTVDEIRRNFEKFTKIYSRVKVAIFIAGVCVPGKYLSGDPIKPEELALWSKLSDKPLKILAGPVARFGLGTEGGKLMELPEKIKEGFDLIIKGDPELVIYRLFKEKLNIDAVDPCEIRDNYKLVDVFSRLGARIIKQHPNYGLNLICEIETYRGCPRHITGGCSFCIEPLYRGVTYRDPSGILREIKALYNQGARSFRLGRQPDFFAYQSFDKGVFEFPRPNPEAIENLLKGIRYCCEDLETLHIDNVNPGTVFHYEMESTKIVKAIIKYHTPGDVAAFGIESTDLRVIKLNNLKVMPEEALEAIKIINRYGKMRGWNGLPHILPGINFVYGLIGETKETYILNYEFMKQVLSKGYVVRRINIRQVLPIPGTRIWSQGTSIISRHKQYFKKYKTLMRKFIDMPMLRRVLPKGTILRSVYTEKYLGNKTLGRQVGSYPILVVIPEKLPLGKKVDVIVISYGFRSVSGLPYPIDINSASPKVVRLIPNIKKETIAKILKYRPFRDENDFKCKVGDTEILRYISFNANPIHR